MNSLFAALLLCLFFAVSAVIPSWLVLNASGMQSEFDSHLSGTAACRSWYDDPGVQTFRFSSDVSLPCPLRRGDYAAPGTNGRWPYALCVLMEATSSQREERIQQCAYR